MSDTLYVVHTMGRCGSVSVAGALMKERLNVIHVHRLRGENADRDAVSQICNHLEEKKPVRVITLIREPVARNISAYFTNHILWGVKPTVEDFLNRYRHDIPLKWIPEQLSFWDYTFQYPIVRPKEFEDYYPGTFLINTKSPVLFIRTMDLDKVWDRAWAMFSDKKVKMGRANSMAQPTRFPQIYHEFIRDAKLPVWYLDMMYQSDYTKTFFSPKEIERLYEIWQ